MRLDISITRSSLLCQYFLHFEYVLSRDEKVLLAKPKGKENGGVGGGSCPHGMEEKLSSPPRHSALACRARLPCTLRRDPWGSEASRALHRHRGGPNLKMLPLSLRSSSSTTTSLIYIYRWYQSHS